MTDFGELPGGRQKGSARMTYPAVERQIGPRARRLLRHRVLPLLAVLGFVATLAVPAQGLAQTAASTEAPPTRSWFSGPKLTTTPADAPDWVKAARPKDGREEAFIPTGRPRSEPPRQVMSRERLMQVERELDALRARHDAIGKRKTVKVSGGSVAGDGVKSRKKTKKAVKCVLTCTTTIGNIRKK